MPHTTAELDAIRRKIRKYQKDHGNIGVPTLGSHIAKATGENVTDIVQSTLQRFLRGRKDGKEPSRNEAIIRICSAFAAPLPDVPDPIGDLGRQMIEFYGPGDATDYAGTWVVSELPAHMKPADPAMQGILLTPASPVLHISRHPDVDCWAVTETVHGHPSRPNVTYPPYHGAMVSTAHHGAVCHLTNALDLSPKTYFIHVRESHSARFSGKSVYRLNSMAQEWLSPDVMILPYLPNAVDARDYIRRARETSAPSDT